jgi:hypothetical protein
MKIVAGVSGLRVEILETRGSESELFLLSQDGRRSSEVTPAKYRNGGRLWGGSCDIGAVRRSLIGFSWRRDDGGA